MINSSRNVHRSFDVRGRSLVSGHWPGSANWTNWANWARSTVIARCPRSANRADGADGANWSNWAWAAVIARWAGFALRSNWTRSTVIAWGSNWAGITVLAGLARKARGACLTKIFVKTMPFLTKIDFLRQYLCSLVGQQVHFCRGSQLHRGCRPCQEHHYILGRQRVQWVQRGLEHSLVRQEVRLCQELRCIQVFQARLDNANCYKTVMHNRY